MALTRASAPTRVARPRRAAACSATRWPAPWRAPAARCAHRVPGAPLAQVGASLLAGPERIAPQTGGRSPHGVLRSPARSGTCCARQRSARLLTRRPPLAQTTTCLSDVNLVMSASNLALLSLGRFVFLPYQREQARARRVPSKPRAVALSRARRGGRRPCADALADHALPQVAKAGAPVQNGVAHLKAGDIRAEEASSVLKTGDPAGFNLVDVMVRAHGWWFADAAPLLGRVAADAPNRNPSSCACRRGALWATRSASPRSRRRAASSKSVWDARRRGGLCDSWLQRALPQQMPKRASACVRVRRVCAARAQKNSGCASPWMSLTSSL